MRVKAVAGLAKLAGAMASLKVALTGVAVTASLSPTLESGTLIAPWLGLDESTTGPVDVPDPLEDPEEPEPPAVLPEVSPVLAPLPVLGV